MRIIKTTPLTEKELDALRLLRLERGWSYQAMSESMGLRPATLVRILNVTASARATTIYRIRRWMLADASARREARTA